MLPEVVNALLSTEFPDDVLMQVIVFDTRCGRTFVFPKGMAPDEQDYRYCPNCGKNITTERMLQ